MAKAKARTLLVRLASLAERISDTWDGAQGSDFAEAAAEAAEERAEAARDAAEDHAGEAEELVEEARGLAAEAHW